MALTYVVGCVPLKGIASKMEEMRKNTCTGNKKKVILAAVDFKLRVTAILHTL